MILSIRKYSKWELSELKSEYGKLSKFVLLLIPLYIIFILLTIFAGNRQLMYAGFSALVSCTILMVYAGCHMEAIKDAIKNRKFTDLRLAKDVKNL